MVELLVRAAVTAVPDRHPGELTIAAVPSPSMSSMTLAIGDGMKVA